ncbi:MULTISPECIES: PH domain-containing protein [Catenuloplanes]|uniref:Low molecular weight protein antigen 6 PH domain-containing protein n=1 Tax=Catenuloplanes niger TaxID=587534 RepID=A0AAE4CT68_9ACTN|nr:PH domain-containing protein [Catenuloplanes niger]MDR7323112.1 hypothetical protein [Catenuloplanes niger]
MKTHWTRPYPPGGGRWLVIAWEAASITALGWTSDRLFGFDTTATVIFSLILAAAWAVGAVRIARMGVYVGDPGVRVRGLFWTRTVPWSDIHRFRMQDVTYRIGTFRIPSGLTVVIDRHDGTEIKTELWAQGVDFHSRPGLFRQVFHELRERHVLQLATNNA